MPAPFTGLANPPIPTDLLLTHAAFLRALAKSLLGDEHAAEDVVQETWVYALEGPPASQERLGGWLRRVTHGLALKHRRSEGRRAGREQSSARDEGLAAVDEALAEQEILRRVVDCVLALEQRYRRVILMRYYQDLPPREIAKRLNLPLATVDSQLHRARELLRRRLDDAAGNRNVWAGALATVTGWKGEAALVAAASGASAGGKFMVLKIGIGAALAASVWVGVNQPSALPSGARASGEQEVASLREVAGTAPAAQAPAQDGSERVAVEAPQHAEPLPGFPVPAYTYSLAGTVVDELDRAVSGARILLAPLDQPLNDVGATGRDGSFSVSWRANVAQMSVVLRVQGAYSAGTLYRYDLGAGRPLEVRLAARTGMAEKQRAEAELAKLEVRGLDRTAGGGVVVEKAAREELGRSIAVRGEQLLMMGGKLAPGLTAQTVPGEGLRYSWPPPVQPSVEPSVNRVAAGFGGMVAPGGMAGGGTVLERRKRPAPAAAPAELVRVVGTVLDANGAPVNDAFILGDDGYFQHGAKSGQDGAFAIELPRTGVLELRAGGGDLGLARTSFALSKEETPAELRWDPVLDRGSEVVGRLVDRAGKHLDDWLVEAVLVDGSSLWLDASFTSDPNGGFAIPNVHGSVGQLLLRRTPASPFAHKVVPGVRPGEEQTIVLEPEELGTGSVRLQAVDDSGAMLADAEARLWQPSSGRGAWLETKGDALRLGDLPRGSYQLTLGSQGRGFVDCGSVWIEPGQETDLGAIALPEAGSVRMTSVSQPRPDQAGLTWRLLRADLPATTVVAVGPITSGLDAKLPAGQYALLVGGAELAAPPLRFAVQPGQETALELDPARLQAVTFVLELPAGVDAPIAWTLVDTDTGAELVTHERTAGAFALYLPEGAYRARASARGLAGAVELVVGAQATEPVRISLQ